MRFKNYKEYKEWVNKIDNPPTDLEKSWEELKNQGVNIEEKKPIPETDYYRNLD